MKFRVCGLFALASVFLAAQVAHAVPVTWNHPDGTVHYYDAIEFTSTWDEANVDAQAQSFFDSNGHFWQGYLATLTSAEEDQFVWDYVIKPLLGSNETLKDAGLSYALGGYQTTDDQGFDQNWAWVTGEEWDYTNWGWNEPTGLDQNHLEFKMGSKKGQWADYAGNFPKGGYIIEYEDPPMSVPVPEPATMLLLGAGLIGIAGFSRKKLKK